MDTAKLSQVSTSPVVVASWNFTVEPAPVFEIDQTVWRHGASMNASSNVRSQYTAGTTYEIAGPSKPNHELFLGPATEDEFADISYKLRFE